MPTGLGRGRPAAAVPAGAGPVPVSTALPPLPELSSALGVSPSSAVDEGGGWGGGRQVQHLGHPLLLFRFGSSGMGFERWILGELGDN